MPTVGRGIYIDDAGTPGVESKSLFLPEDRKSFCAVVVPGEIEEPLSEALDIFLAAVKQEFGAVELHFTEIYSGRGAWKGVEPGRRKEIFDLMLTLMESFSLPIFYQTSSESYETSQIAMYETREDVWWDFSNVAHQALLWLCHVTARELRNYRKEPDSYLEFHQPFETRIDAGLMKAGARVQLPNWGDIFLDQSLQFVSSDECPGVQLADFAAFCIARAQWIAGRQDPGTKLKEADQHILESSGRLNVWNLHLAAVDSATFSRDAYEWGLKRFRHEKGLSTTPKKRRW